MSVLKLHNHNVYHCSHPNYYKIATLVIIVSATITALSLLGTHQWSSARYKAAILNYFSTHLLQKAVAVSLLGVMIIAFPYGIAYALSYKCGHLKKDGFSAIEASLQPLLRRIAEHNGAFLAKNDLLRNELEHHPNLNKIFQILTEEMVDDFDADPRKVIEKLTKIFPMIREEIDQNELLADAQVYLDTINTNHSISASERVVTFRQKALVAFGNIIEAIGVADLFTPAESEIHASFKAQKILMLVSLGTMLASILVPAIGPVKGGGTVGAILGTIVLLSILWPIIRPTPSAFPGNAIDLTKAIAEGKEVFDGREEISDELADIFASGQHALIIAPSRTGKNKAVEAFAKAVYEGKYPHLKGKKVFYWNTADLANQQASFLGGAANILHSIEQTAGHHNDDLIFVFDEIHNADDKSKLMEKMKIYFDGPCKFAIGITTKIEYDKHIAPNEPFALRFTDVIIENTDPEQTKRILIEKVLRSPLQHRFEEGALQYLIESCVENAPQPFTANRLLEKCLQELNRSSSRDDKKRLTKLQQRIKSHRLQAILTTTHKTTHHQAIKGLQEEYIQLNREVGERNIRRKKLLRARHLLSYTTEAKYRLALAQERPLAQIQLFSRFEKEMGAYIDTQAHSLQLYPSITRELIDSIFKKEEVEEVFV